MALATVTLNRNLTRLEVAMAGILILVLAVVFLNRVRNIEQAAEQAMIIARVQDLQSRLLSMRLLISTGHFEGDSVSAQDIVARIVDGDIVVVDGYGDKRFLEAAPGTWQFVSTDSVFVYHAQNDTGIEGVWGEPPRVSYRLKLLRDGDAVTGKAVGAALELVQPPATERK